MKYRGRAGLGLELAPDLRHVHAEVVRLVLVPRAPDLLQELALTDQLPGMPHEDLDEVPLGRRETNGRLRRRR